MFPLFTTGTADGQLDVASGVSDTFKTDGASGTIAYNYIPATGSHEPSSIALVLFGIAGGAEVLSPTGPNRGKVRCGLIGFSEKSFRPERANGISPRCAPGGQETRRR